MVPHCDGSRRACEQRDHRSDRRSRSGQSYKEENWERDEKDAVKRDLGREIATHVLARLKATIHHAMQPSIGYLENPLTGEFNSCDGFALDALYDFLATWLVTPDNWLLADEIVRNGELSPAQRLYYRAVLNANKPRRCHPPGGRMFEDR